jgi:hypothetical protein
MKLAKRIITVVAAPALLAGIMLAGSASAKPTVASGPKLPFSIAFTVTATVGTTTASVTSTSCTLTAAGGTTHTCFLAGAASLGVDEPDTGNFAVTGTGFGPVTVSLTQESSSCGDGTGLVIQPSGPDPVLAKANISKITGTGPYTLKGTLKVGPNVVGCPEK